MTKKKKKEKFFLKIKKLKQIARASASSEKF